MSEVTAKPTSIDQLEVGMELQGTVKRIELFGAFVDIGIGHDGLLHISQLGQANVRNVEDVVKTGEKITVYVLKVERDTGRIALSPMPQLGRGSGHSQRTLRARSRIRATMSAPLGW